MATVRVKELRDPEQRFDCHHYDTDVRAGECVRRQNADPATANEVHCTTGKCQQGRDVAKRLKEAVASQAAPTLRLGELPCRFHGGCRKAQAKGSELCAEHTEQMAQAHRTRAGTAATLPRPARVEATIPSALEASAGQAEPEHQRAAERLKSAGPVVTPGAEPLELVAPPEAPPPEAGFVLPPELARTPGYALDTRAFGAAEVRVDLGQQRTFAEPPAALSLSDLPSLALHPPDAPWAADVLRASASLGEPPATKPQPAPEPPPTTAPEKPMVTTTSLPQPDDTCGAAGCKNPQFARGACRAHWGLGKSLEKAGKPTPAWFQGRSKPGPRPASTPPPKALAPAKPAALKSTAAPRKQAKPKRDRMDAARPAPSVPRALAATKPARASATPPKPSAQPELPGMPEPVAIPDFDALPLPILLRAIAPLERKLGEESARMAELKAQLRALVGPTA